MRLILAKVFATVLVSLCLAYPLVDPDARTGVLASVAGIGAPALLALVAAFLAAVALYCRSLQRCLEQIHPESRKADPRSVWLMFLIPYNFVEDFFIVHNVARSLRAAAATDPSLGEIRSYGTASGLGWCAAQIVSLVPNRVGGLAGVVALVLWLVHWRCIARANGILGRATRTMAGPPTAGRAAPTLTPGGAE